MKVCIPQSTSKLRESHAPNAYSGIYIEYELWLRILPFAVLVVPVLLEPWRPPAA